MGRKRNESGHLGRKKMKILGMPHSKFYVVDVDHLEDTSTIHPIDIRSLNSIYPTIGKTLESICHVDDKRKIIYPPIGKRETLQSRKKRVELKSTSVYPPLTKKGIFEIKVGRVGMAGAKKRASVSTKEELLERMEAGLDREEHISATMPKSSFGLPDARNTLRIMREAPVVIIILNTNGT